MKVREGKGVWLVEASMAEAAVPKTVSLVCTVSELTSRLRQGSGARQKHCQPVLERTGRYTLPNQRDTSYLRNALQCGYLATELIWVKRPTCCQVPAIRNYYYQNNSLGKPPKRPSRTGVIILAAPQKHLRHVEKCLCSDPAADQLNQKVQAQDCVMDNSF